MSERERATGRREGARDRMSAERWLRVQDVFTAAIACDIAKRGALLDQECADDAGLRRDVESLLGGHDRSGLVDRLVAQISAPALWRAHVDAMEWEGRRVAQYVVLEPLGAGAMGLVYKARDERLDRYVALKFLPPHLNAQPSAKQRFLLEARTAAALDHANICTIHEIGETADGQLFIAMPLYDGETLQDRLERAPLCLREATAIALQIAQGLAKAHEHGIVHRDVKPSNVMLLRDGSVKILDFGIARVADVSFTTREGVAVGTVAYMSPEQARGEPVDVRTDIWSLGVVFYEMVTGTRPFSGENAQAITFSILATDPPAATALRAELPVEINDLIGNALAKGLQRRYASMECLAADLAALAQSERFARRVMGVPSETMQGVAASTGERRRAAVLVSIVSDYPALVEQLSPEELEKLIGHVRNAAVEVVRRHGGLVNYVFGEEIVALFGIPTGHEDDDLRAVRAAMELHALVLDVSVTAARDFDVPLRMQSGVHAGLLVAQRLNEGPRRYGVTGPAAQSAARLAALAPPNAILLSPQCRHLVAPFVDTESHEPMVLQSDSAPVTPYRVIGESGLQTRLEAAARKGLTPYAGRAAELAALDGQFAQARTGHGQMVLVVGEAGVGKSRLLYELRERIGAADVRILQARCRSYGGIVPYLPFVEILREALHMQALESHAISVSDIVADIRRIDASLEPFVPLYLHLLSLPSDTHPLPRHLRGKYLQEAMPEAIAAFLTLFARGSPTVLLLEDGHWIDDGSREALRRLVEIAPAHAMLIVVTSRPGRVDPVDWAAQVTCIQLAPLDFDASVAVMQGVLHVQRVSDELARRVYERTGGNPFFLEEICQTLLEQGSVAARDGEGVAAGGVEELRLPDTVQAVIRTRLDGLDRQSLEVLRVAAVIGREFSQQLLVDAIAAKSDPTWALERLKAAGLIQQISVVPEVAYRFKHVLTQEVTYDSLLGHQRRSLHSAIAREIERRHPDRIDEHAELLAYHFIHAQAWLPAVRYGRHAADRASALSQFADALAMLEPVREALMHLPDDEERGDLLADVLLQQERLCETLGQRGRQQQIVDELIALLAPRGASARLAHTYLRQGDLLTLLKRFDAADRALSTALRVSRERGDAVLERHALRSIGLLRWHEGRHTEALAIIEGALAIDRERHDDLAVAGDLANMGVIFKSMGEHSHALATFERALASFDEALAIPALAQDPPTLVYCLQNRANVHRALGDLDRALECLQRANEISRQHLLPIQRSFHLTAIAHILLQQGRMDESLQTYDEAVELSRRARHADGLVQSLRALGEVLFGLGRDAEALPRLQEAAQLFSRLEDPVGEVEMWSRVATILEKTSPASEWAQAWEKVRALRTRLGDARGELEALEGIARSARQRAQPPVEAIAHVEAALALAATLGEKRREVALCNTLGILEWECGRYAQALRHYEMALGLSRELGVRAYEGLILNSLGVTLSRLNRHEEAHTALEESVLLNRDTGERLLEAHALAALGDVCQARGRFAAASEYFEQSLTLRRILGDKAGEAGMLQRLAQTPSVRKE